VDDARVSRYLDRIGFPRNGGEPDVARLAELQERHLHAVPFENLSVHLEEPIDLTPEALVDKIVERNRGGFCYELNGAFGALLTALGYEVTLLCARAATPDGFGPPFDHLALRVDVDGEPWLVDVGFGRFSHRPIRLAERGEQKDPAGTFVVTEDAEGDLTVLRNGGREYRMEARPRTLADFEPTCWWHRTSPKSHFTRSLVCSRLTETGRVTLSGNTLILTDDTGKQEMTLHTDAEILDAYSRHFGISLDRVPTVRQS
jgi:N-hydroxyarylamine O-acetyltransferase